ncbi:hypothetical protein [Sphingosinicella sp. BN140058]|uniref:hypothetical protein n=1 Tax=Sphingosinicella sp. BN140058 TaxID=1892855 RepID=UPI0010129DA6|nr:hypothetical protein [Sphingosinicella sp. BN140058]QAY76120.1 hypothetical protein ETR14_05940 [Sphingosinicella sp. BN140058]
MSNSEDERPAPPRGRTAERPAARGGSMLTPLLAAASLLTAAPLLLGSWLCISPALATGEPGAAILLVQVVSL